MSTIPLHIQRRFEQWMGRSVRVASNPGRTKEERRIESFAGSTRDPSGRRMTRHNSQAQRNNAYRHDADNKSPRRAS
jgi:hypothetical protein